MHNLNTMRRTTRQHPQQRAAIQPPGNAGSLEPAVRLTLVSRYNDDGHFCGLEPTWIPLGVAVGLALSRAT